MAALHCAAKLSDLRVMPPRPGTPACWPSTDARDTRTQFTPTGFGSGFRNFVRSGGKYPHVTAQMGAQTFAEIKTGAARTKPLVRHDAGAKRRQSCGSGAESETPYRVSTLAPFQPKVGPVPRRRAGFSPLFREGDGRPPGHRPAIATGRRARRGCRQQGAGLVPPGPIA
jgi:hypothetical protein